MSFANAVNAGINAGTALVGPLAQSFDPIRQLQAQSLRQQIDQQNTLGPLQARSIESAIREREVFMPIIEDMVARIEAARSKASSPAAGEASDDLRDAMERFKSRIFSGPIGPTTSPAAPSAGFDMLAGPLSGLGTFDRLQGPLGGLGQSVAGGPATVQVTPGVRPEFQSKMREFQAQDLGNRVRASRAAQDEFIGTEAARQESFARDVVRSKLHQLVPVDMIRALNEDEIEDLIGDLIQSGAAAKVLPQSFDPRTGVSEPLVPRGRPTSATDLLQQLASEPFIQNQP